MAVGVLREVALVAPSGIAPGDLAARSGVLVGAHQTGQACDRRGATDDGHQFDRPSHDQP